ncbi:TetR/AcrR family transcriptional regulator [Pseudooceanicola spongiae]|uniref:TetR family transcriptional regulator n=1 Tax=Pseudooceanicola spongiae TaxID=2613965 RepID=A0A7L9WLK8_9RHOB|nr:TetR/AcrR family transcriptional regulator [Pseudooceanicola spongiae]QOL80724.1 TetR family transcriptional regulator [Pseudooceanicola spongiae]
MARTAGSTSSETGHRLRQAAVALFARHGYAAVSMRQIAAATGVQVGALYNHTADKQSLLFDLLSDHMDALLAALEAEALPDDPLAALEAFTRFHLRYHAARPDAVFIAYMELRNLTPDNFARVEAQRRAYEAQLEDILRRGSKAEVMRFDDAKLACLAIIALLTGVTTWFRADGRLRQSEVEDIYWSMTRRLVSA